MHNAPVGFVKVRHRPTPSHKLSLILSANKTQGIRTMNLTSRKSVESGKQKPGRFFLKDSGFYLTHSFLAVA